MNKLNKFRRDKRGKPIVSKIYVWSHTEKAEIEYFQSLKNDLRNRLLEPKKKKDCLSPQELIKDVVLWKNRELNSKDKDQVWCVFDVDDFFKDDRNGLTRAIKNADKNGIKIAYINECFEHWILMHFEIPDQNVSRGKEVENKIQKLFKENNLGSYQKNDNVFTKLEPFQQTALANAKKLLKVDKYESIDWSKVLSEGGRPSTSIHFLIEEIYRLSKK